MSRPGPGSELRRRVIAMGAWARAVVMMARVKKTTGGKLWHKPWGIPKVTPTQKVNYKKRNQRLRSNLDVLRVAHAAEEAAKGGGEKIVIPSFEKSAIYAARFAHRTTNP